MSKQLGRSLKCSVKSVVAAEKPCLERTIGERRMSAVINASDFEASEASTNLHVVFGNEGRKVEALEIDLLRLDLGRDKEMVVEGLKLSTEDGNDRVVGRSPYGRPYYDVLMKVDPCCQVVRKHKPVHSGLREKDITSLTSDSNRRKAA